MVINKLYTAIKKNSLVKKIRVEKQLYVGTRKYMLSRRKVKKTEKNLEQKKIIVNNQMKKFPQKTDELKVKIDKIVSEVDYEEKNKEELILDMFFSYFAYGFSPNEYVCYELENKSLKERLEFMSDRGSVYYGYKMNDIDSMQVFMNKIKTYNRFKKYYQRDAISISSESDKNKFYNFVNKHHNFVKKAVNESCGRSIEMIQMKDIKDDLFYKLISEGEVILEECVKQDKSMANLNSSSVNTVRCITINTRQGILIPYCFLKVGRAGAFVDNGGAGGILVGIDCKTGVLNSDGVDEINRRYCAHPDSGIVFKNFQLPNWNQLLSICSEMSMLEPDVRFIGWDMAYTEKGWIVIEGNALSEVIGPQATSKTGIRSTLTQYL